MLDLRLDVRLVPRLARSRRHHRDRSTPGATRNSGSPSPPPHGRHARCRAPLSRAHPPITRTSAHASPSSPTTIATRVDSKHVCFEFSPRTREHHGAPDLARLAFRPWGPRSPETPVLRPRKPAASPHQCAWVHLWRSQNQLDSYPSWCASRYSIHRRCIVIPLWPHLAVDLRQVGHRTYRIGRHPGGVALLPFHGQLVCVGIRGVST